MMDGDFNTTALTDHDQGFREEVLDGLSQPQKSLGPKWLYDHAGSALFEQITGLPEYYLTRTETGILQTHAAEIAQLVAPGGALVEFGSGASVKTRLVLDQGEHFGAYVPIDISEDFLVESAIGLRDAYPGMRIVPIVGDFLHPVAFPDVLAGSAKTGFFPGSTIGNLSPQDATTLLLRARDWPGVRHFVVGFDLVKDRDTLVAAYDDAQGVTARFIGNILVRLNRELGAEFDLDAFSYRAAWNDALSQIEMSLVSDRAQRVTVAEDAFDFAAGEAIRISTSRKFTYDSFAALAASGGWRMEQVLTDPQERFAVGILAAAR